jgi:hypothetical protein
MVAHLLVISMRHPMRACSPRNHMLIEVTNQIGKITKTTTSTRLRNRIDYLHFLQLHPLKHLANKENIKHVSTFRLYQEFNKKPLITNDWSSDTTRLWKDFREILTSKLVDYLWSISGNNVSSTNFFAKLKECLIRKK